MNNKTYEIVNTEPLEKLLRERNLLVPKNGGEREMRRQRAKNWGFSGWNKI